MSSRKEQRGRRSTNKSTAMPESTLPQTLDRCSQSLTESLTTLQEPATGVEKVPWTDVLRAAEQVSKQATVAGNLWCDHVSTSAGRENIKSFSDSLQGFLLLCHGSTVGAGPTLLKAINLSAKQVLHTSLTFLSQAISLRGDINAAERKSVIPQLTACVWDACDALKKTPTTNSTAIGRSLTQIAASVKDVLRELQELKEMDRCTEDCEACTEDCEAAGTSAGDGVEDGNVNASDIESLGSLEIDGNLSSKEMEIAKSIKEFILSILEVLKELLYFSGRLTKLFKEKDDNAHLYSLERILDLYQVISVQVDELGASCYPPQEIHQMKMSAQKIEECIGEIQEEVKKIDGNLETFKSATQQLGKHKDNLLELLNKTN